ncbi:asparagine synthase (glutamine-hydrolysing) [Rivibacter subsaxonicus]|uniref:asparagine synthase (glutamine-hydrolyzing) n=2 Tax=Rivibacter subsaxonicus TaxID=457575 RepID=A0A4Q7VW08_9BURK|nr:asparagine synthase (glutamine-hydrolyzing) [Rivibacter subsaxonicus]RZU00783.1 asparagine synthase (glutamine-hydrolysing) [Rivibacter subsaxonicus]
MCGISGIFNLDGAPVDRDRLQSMTDTLHHRGPDGSGLFVDGAIGLGHRRLSIIDLEGGSQPIGNEDDSIQVVFNGEIYNFIELRDELIAAGHRFKTRSDTEVIVHAYEQWGTDCLNRFNGMFSFALWDGRERRLFLARDHLGVKPLYYHRTGNTLLFGSEVKSLLSYPDCTRDVDLRALGELFTFRYVPSPRTLFSGISKLPPGHFMVADQAGISIRRFWNWVPKHLSDPNEGALIEEYLELVDSAVRLQLRSDVPVGLFLSSGVDSASLLSAMRRQLTGRIHTFTIGFEGGEKSNETDDASDLARHFGTDHEQMIVGASDYEQYFERYMWDLEEPVGNESAAAFYFVSLIASRRVKVVLTGQGADEPWAGYQRHLGVQLSESYRRLPRWLTGGLIKPAVQALPRNERLKRGVATLDEPDDLTRFTKIYSFFTPEMRSRLFSQDMRAEIGYQAYEAREALAHLQRDVASMDPVSQMLYMDTRASLPDDLLMVNDKMSMANSIESRVPFLDRRLVEFVETLPTRYKLRSSSGKYLHKKALERWLPPAVVHRKKKGFDNPVQQWLRSKLLQHVESALFSADSSIRQYFDVDYVRRLVDLHGQGRENYMRHIYLLVSFEMWHRRFMRGA